jgi:adenine-specific DNA-methyltransferase
MMAQRLPALKEILAEDAAIFISLDDAELHRAISLLEQTFSASGHLATFARRTKSGGGSAADAFAVEHDYVIAWAKNSTESRKFFIKHDPEYLKRYSESDEDGRYFWDTMERSSTATKPYLIEAPDGSLLNGRWFRSEARFKEDQKRGDARVVKVGSGTWSVQFKQRLAAGRKMRSLMAENEFRSQPKDLGDLGFGDLFTYPKTLFLLERVIECSTFSENTGAFVLDPFAGSGTTGHAVINLNREDGGDRKYILIEMGEHFDTVLVPRLKKVIYSKDWKDGKPQSRNTGISHCFKILRLESYEDTLNNLRLHRTREQELALEKFSPEAREDYQLGYMLDLEATGSQSLLNVSAFTDPFDYTLQIATGTAGETKPTQVDLVETFNWLLGLTVLAQGHGGGVTWVEGTNPEGEKVLVLWRNTTAVDAEALNAWCKKQKISVLDGEFAVIYVNGDHHLENLRRDDQTWKVRLTDEEFPKLMWEGCE